MRVLITLLLATAVSLGNPALAADPDQPHPHQGIVTAYDGAPPMPELSAEDLEKLAKGKPVKKQIEMETGGRGIAIQDIHATPEVVWSRIVRYDKYTEWVDGVFECEEYENTGDNIKVRFKIGGMGVRVEYFITHTYLPAEGYMTWTLDYTRESDLDDSVGFWRVVPIEDKAGWTRVYYSVDVRLKGWVPKFIETMLAKNGLTKATAWVKRESELSAGTAEP
ncbi:MAG: SRPBCC family protein [Deltaproteobacteria bacterium]|nr:SRPBCC family protein [Deltaproteobacteria bacterium]MBW2253313.1 SRPBCC family protein [Deltaproteobacteria bacterium]